MQLFTRSLIAGGMFALTVSLAFAAETLTLTDGRIFKDATILSQSPRSVIVRHAGGLASVEKTKLPAALRERYPVDEAAAQREEAAILEARERAQAAAAVPAANPAESPAPAAATASAPTLSVEEAAKAKKADVLLQATALAKRHFETGHTLPIGQTVECTVTLSDAREVDGWGDRWLVNGQAVLRYSRELDPRRERELSEDNEVTRKMTATEIRRARARETFVRSEVVTFEGYVTNPATASTIEIVVR